MSNSKCVVVYRDCGCICFAAAKIPSLSNDIGKAIGAAIRDGQQYGEITAEEVRNHPWKCEKCRPQSGLKPVSG